MRKVLLSATLIFFSCLVVSCSPSHSEAPGQADSAIVLDVPWTFTGENLKITEQVTTVSFRKALFQGTNLTNPSRPRITHDGLQFEAPGSYFLELNGKLSVNLMVFDATATDRENVAVIFDFLTVHNSTANAHDAWIANSGADGYLLDLVSSTGPIHASCGPTLALFRYIAEEALDLRTRAVSWPGWHFDNHRVAAVTHNAIDVYLREEKKWQYYDPNSSFIPKNMSSIGLSLRALQQHPDLDIQTKPSDWLLEISETSVESFHPVSQDVGSASEVQIDFSRPRQSSDSRQELAKSLVFGIRFLKSEVSELDSLSAKQVASIEALDGNYVTFVHDSAPTWLKEANLRWHRHWNASDEIQYQPFGLLGEN